MSEPVADVVVQPADADVSEVTVLTQVLPLTDYPDHVCSVFTFEDGTRLLLTLTPEAAAAYGNEMTKAALRLLPAPTVA